MRRTLIISALASSALTVGFTASAIQATDSDPAAPTTVPDIPGLDNLGGLGITQGADSVPP